MSVINQEIYKTGHENISVNLKEISINMILVIKMSFVYRSAVDKRSEMGKNNILKDCSTLKNLPET